MDDLEEILAKLRAARGSAYTNTPLVLDAVARAVEALLVLKISEDNLAEERREREP